MSRSQTTRLSEQEWRVLGGAAAIEARGGMPQPRLDTHLVCERKGFGEVPPHLKNRPRPHGGIPAGMETSVKGGHVPPRTDVDRYMDRIVNGKVYQQ
jgi:hypothetical protein